MNLKEAYSASKWQTGKPRFNWESSRSNYDAKEDKTRSRVNVSKAHYARLQMFLAIRNRRFVYTPRGLLKDTGGAMNQYRLFKDWPWEG